MTSAHDTPLHAPVPDGRHPLRTIREIRGSLPADQIVHFDAEIAEADIDDLPVVLARWATVGTDGFLDFLLSTPFEGAEFGSRSYDDDAEGQ